MKKLLFAAVLLLLTVAQVPVREAAASVCTDAEIRSCESQCNLYRPSGCAVGGTTCNWDINHSVCGCDYYCLYGGHDPTGGGFKHLEVIDNPYAN